MNNQTSKQTSNKQTNEQTYQLYDQSETASAPEISSWRGTLYKLYNNFMTEQVV